MFQGLERSSPTEQCMTNNWTYRIWVSEGIQGGGLVFFVYTMEPNNGNVYYLRPLADDKKKWGSKQNKKLMQTFQMRFRPGRKVLGKRIEGKNKKIFLRQARYKEKQRFKKKTVIR